MGGRIAALDERSCTRVHVAFIRLALHPADVFRNIEEKLCFS